MEYTKPYRTYEEQAEILIDQRLGAAEAGVPPEPLQRSLWQPNET